MPFSTFLFLPFLHMATMSADRISRLPRDVRVHILTFLPLKDAAKSTILSSKWRNLWTNLPTLVIDQSLCKIWHIRCLDVNEVILNIYRVLLLHVGPLKDFSLTHRVLGHQIYHILRILPYQNLESLTIDASRYYKLSNQVFSSFSQLKKLFLSRCRFTFSPISFEGFDRLTVLQFQKNLAQLRFKCPLLTTLTLEDCGTSRQRPVIVIEEAPNLSFFLFDGCFASLRLEHTPCLKDVIINKRNALSNGKRFGPTLLETNRGLAAVESLSVSGYFYEYLATGEIPYLEDIYEPWKKLRCLRLDDLYLSTGYDVWSSVCMIIASPNLQQLSIQMSEYIYLDMDGFNGYSEALGIMQCGAVTASESYTRRILTRVEVKMVKGTRNQMTLIKWLLNISPMLEELKIQLCTELSDSEKLLIVSEFNGFRRASNRAEITLE